MAIKNYTTTVEVHKSLGEIQGALAGHGARKIMVDYDGAGQPVGITFGIETPDGPRGFLLPANVAGVKAVFARQKVRAPEGQAERTAWRNVRDWIMAQMAIVEAGQVEKVWRGEWDYPTCEWNLPKCPKCGCNSKDAMYGHKNNFCPRCGEAMTDEAVDMVVRRLEALHEISPST